MVNILKKMTCLLIDDFILNEQSSILLEMTNKIFFAKKNIFCYSKLKLFHHILHYT